MGTTHHDTVLCEEVVRALTSEREEPRLLFDGTLGGGGHTEALLRRVPGSVVVALDVDSLAIERAKNRLGALWERVVVRKENFRNLNEIEAGISEELRDRFVAFSALANLEFDGMVLDLGISSDQLDDPDRGLSFRTDGPLDMRLSHDLGETAADLLNRRTERELLSLFSAVGLRSRKLVDVIICSRPITTTMQFKNICDQVLGTPRERRLRAERGSKNINPATVPFLALRAAVNDEFGALKEFLDIAPGYLAHGGRLSVISFHSLEDKFVTQAMRKWSAPGPRGLPMGNERMGKLLTSQAVKPGEEEVTRNPRARSALLRVFEMGA